MGGCRGKGVGSCIAHPYSRTKQNTCTDTFLRILCDLCDWIRSEGQPGHKWHRLVDLSRLYYTEYIGIIID